MTTSGVIPTGPWMLRCSPSPERVLRMTAKRATGLLCLDFDGVICNSVNECMLVAFNAYSGTGYTGLDALPAGYRETFRRYRYLVRDPGEYFLLIDMFYRGADIDETRFADAVNQKAFRCRNFKVKFFAARRELRDRDLQAWLRLHPPYKGFVDFIKRVSVPIDIITTKDEESVNLLLQEYAVRDKVGHVFGQEALAIYGGKAGAIREACRRSGIAPGEVAYLDDHLKHLADVRETGAKLWYATWGYTNPSPSEMPDDVHALVIDRAQEMLGEQ